MKSVALGLVAGLSFVSTAALAQTGEVSGEATGQATVTTPTAPVVTRPAAPVVVAAARDKDDDLPDHQRFVGRFAVGYFGVSQLPIAATTGTALARDNVNAPVVGVRWWMKENLGLDLGLGFGMSGGSTETVNGGTTTTTDKASKLGLAVHGGVPLAFAHGKHYSFLVVPELTVGFATGTIKPGGGAPDIDLSGFKLDLGGRVGAEIHFGFIGVPELSLQGSVGLFFRREAYKAKVGDNSASDGTTTLGTSVQNDPWALFVNNISAFYYF
jgi:hypothetical protein